jgi:Zn-dependent peptidase ImmA (M78 family)
MTNLVEVAGSAVTYFSEVDPSSFSAVTIFRGSHRMIVHNDSHVPGRQKSDVSHELSHALLLHPPTPAIDDRGCRTWNRDVEDEAEWLSGALLVPEEAALWTVSQGLTIPEAAEFYGVTNKLMTFRITITAARKRVARGEGRYSRHKSKIAPP